MNEAILFVYCMFSLHVFVCVCLFCLYLNEISFLDPQEWSRDQVRAWLQYTMKQFKISITQDIENVFDEDGRQLSRLNEIDFVNRIPQVIILDLSFLSLYQLIMKVMNKSLSNMLWQRLLKTNV